MTGRKTLVFGEVCGCMLVIQAAEAPSDEEAAAYVTALEPYVSATSAPKVLVVTEGGAPGPSFRRRIDQVIEPRISTTRFAIVTNSTFARGVLGAIRLLYPFYQGFSPTDMAGALRFLNVPQSQSTDVLRRVSELRAELGLPPVKG
jgi:hypothetical protein